MWLLPVVTGRDTTASVWEKPKLQGSGVFPSWTSRSSDRTVSPISAISSQVIEGSAWRVAHPSLNAACMLEVLGSRELPA